MLVKQAAATINVSADFDVSAQGSTAGMAKVAHRHPNKYFVTYMWLPHFVSPSNHSYKPLPASMMAQQEEQQPLLMLIRKL